MIDIAMTRAKDWRPTAVDYSAFPEEYAEWYVGLIRTRDDGPLERSNFDTAATILNGIEDGRGHDIIRIRHWGCGWYDVLLVDPACEKSVQEMQEIFNALDDYPVLDDVVFYEYEREELCEVWRGMSLRDRIEACARAGLSILSARHGVPPPDIEPRHVGY